MTRSYALCLLVSVKYIVAVCGFTLASGDVRAEPRWEEYYPTELVNSGSITARFKEIELGPNNVGGVVSLLNSTDLTYCFLAESLQRVFLSLYVVDEGANLNYDSIFHHEPSNTLHESFTLVNADLPPGEHDFVFSSRSDFQFVVREGENHGIDLIPDGLEVEGYLEFEYVRCDYLDEVGAIPSLDPRDSGRRPGIDQGIFYFGPIGQFTYEAKE